MDLLANFWLSVFNTLMIHWPMIYLTLTEPFQYPQLTPLLLSLMSSCSWQCSFARVVSNRSFPPAGVDGGYSQWSMWSICSATCGVGVKMRSRICNSPPPRKGGKKCSRLGKPYETAECNEGECPKSTYMRSVPLRHFCPLTI